MVVNSEDRSFALDSTSSRLLFSLDTARPTERLCSGATEIASSLFILSSEKLYLWKFEDYFLENILCVWQRFHLRTNTNRKPVREWQKSQPEESSPLAFWCPTLIAGLEASQRDDHLRELNLAEFSFPWQSPTWGWFCLVDSLTVRPSTGNSIGDGLKFASFRALVF